MFPMRAAILDTISARLRKAAQRAEALSRRQSAARRLCHLRQSGDGQWRPGLRRRTRRLRRASGLQRGCAKLREASDFVERQFLPRLRALATCETSGACRDPVDGAHVIRRPASGRFAHHGFCARSPNDPPFDRECFLENGESFESNPSEAATDPLRCNLRARDFRPYTLARALDPHRQ